MSDVVGSINRDSQSLNSLSRSSGPVQTRISLSRTIFIGIDTKRGAHTATAHRDMGPNEHNPSMVRRRLDPPPLHTIDKAPRDGPSQHGSFPQIVWGISTSNTGRVPVSSIINALCTALTFGGRSDFQLHVCFLFPHEVLMSVAARCLFFCCLYSTSPQTNVARSFMHTGSSPKLTR